jgi:hypothetical protein
LKELYIRETDDSLNLAIANFCPKLRILSNIFFSDGIESLKEILNSCQYLVSIRVWYKENILEAIAKYSSKSLYELKICNSYPGIFSSELESFFISWKNRTPQKLLSFDILALDFEIDDDMKVLIEKYKELGILKEFKELQFKTFEEEESKFTQDETKIKPFSE